MADVCEFIQCDQRNYTPGRRGQRVRRVVVHYTGAKGNAHENLVYFSRNRCGASAHYFIGKGGDVRQSVRESDTAWHAGNWGMNLMSVGIEVCSAGEDFTEAQVASLASLVGDLMRRYGIPASGVIRHYDVTGKHCPAPYVDAGKWARLHARITGGGAAAPAKAAPAGGSGGSASGGGFLVRVTADALNVRSGPGTQFPKAGCIRDRGTYTIVETRDGWGRLRSGAGWICLNYTTRAGSAGPSPTVDVDALARAVIRGEYGTGAERRRRLGANYDAVQRRVNEILR